MKPTRKVLIAVDDRFQANMLSHIFGIEGFLSVSSACDDAFGVARDERPDVAIVVVDALGVIAADIARQLRTHASTKTCVVLVLFETSDEETRLQVLDAGADELLAKSCSMTELMHRVRLLLRRLGEGDDGNEVRAGDILLNVSARTVKRGPRTIILAPLEAKLLQFLMHNRDRPISRQELIDGVWGQTALVDARTVDVAVNRLRRNLNVNGDLDPIRTLHGEGYAFGIAKVAKPKSRASVLARGAEKVTAIFASFEITPLLIELLEKLGGRFAV